MTTETTPETVTVELNVEAAYQQLVAHETAYREFTEAQEREDVDAQLAATVDAVEAALSLINEIVPRDLSNQLHERLEREHPGLKLQDPLQALLAQLLGGGGE